MNLMLFERGEVSEDGEAQVSDGRAVHLLNVLKVTPGRQVRIGMLDGPHGVGTVQVIGPRTVGVHCTFDTAVPDRPRVDLLLALPRPKVMRRLWAQIAALGVGQIMLTNAERVERNYFDTHVLDAATYHPLLVEGLQQARDTRLPRVSIHRQFRRLVEDELDRLFESGCRVATDPGAPQPLTDVLRDRGGGRVLLAIGPEGGWNDFERQLLGARDFTFAGMGHRTLRTDTACLSLIALAHDALDRA